MQDTVNDRIRTLIKEMKLSVNGFCNVTGIPQSTIASMFRKGTAPSVKTLNTIIEHTRVNRDWLLTGTGEMLNQGRQPEEDGDAPPSAYMVPLLPVSAQAGSLNDFVVSVKASDCEMVVSPIKGAECAVPITGDSMSPNYPPGAQVMAKRINEKAFIEWGRVYVLDTCNGIVIKQVFPADDPDKVRCVSINTTYPPFDVAFSDIYGIYRVLACIELM